jgi:alkylmercury lyase-like protein
LTEDSDVRLHIYRTFVRTGRPPTAAESVRALGISEEEAADAYRRLHDGHVIVLEPDSLDVWMANPLSARPTGFQVRTADGRSYFGTCSWDGPGVLAMLGQDGTVSTTCPDCDEPLTMEIKGGELQPLDVVAHFAVPAARWWEDIGHT